MANLYIKNVPEDLHERLRNYARVKRLTMSQAVFTAIDSQVARWEFTLRLAQRPKTELIVNAAETIREERRLRDIELDWRSTF
jgi:plasmid stability protein